MDHTDGQVTPSNPVSERARQCYPILHQDNTPLLDDEYFSLQVGDIYDAMVQFAASETASLRARLEEAQARVKELEQHRKVDWDEAYQNEHI